MTGLLGPAGFAIVLGIVVVSFVAAIFAAVLLSIRGATARARAALTEEGIALESGPCWITIHYRDFRAPGIYRGVGVTKTRATLVLTAAGRILLVPGRSRYWLVPGNVTVSVAADGALHLHSDAPTGGTGSIDYRVTTPDAERWMRVLTEAGARRS
jgi:hypothetical protein